MNNEVPKIEGHAAFYAHLKAGRVDKAQMIGLENDRFVEKILFGRKYFEAPIITSRICGICPTIHNVTATRAIEDACGIMPSAQTKKLRKLMLCGQMIQSHSLHLYLLVLPDFVGLSSSFELQKSHPEMFENAIKLKRFADSILETIGGRAVHPISNTPGGFKQFPEKKLLMQLQEKAKEAKEIAEKTAILFRSFKFPVVYRDMPYGAMELDNEYAYYEGEIRNTLGKNYEAKNYNHYIYEELKHYTRAKFATIRGKEFMVGAMARLNISHEKLNQETINLAKTLNIKFPLTNPFNNIIAQALENYFFVTESETLINCFIKEGVDNKELVKLPKSFGVGTAACEAPRGTLYHHYELDKDGYIIKCDIITPTVQNLPPLELDMKNLGPLLKKLAKPEQNKLIEMLIRAYDPCITCATH